MGSVTRRGTLSSQLSTCLQSAPSDMMTFLEACTMGNIDRVEHLINKGVNVNQTGEFGNTGLMMAAIQNQVEVLERLLDLDTVDINQRGIQGNTALTYAAGQGHSFAVYQLIRSGANVNATTTDGKTGLGLATSRRNLSSFLDLAGMLVQAGCRPTEKDLKSLKEAGHVYFLVAQMELLRTQTDRLSLRYQARSQVIKSLIESNHVRNPGRLYNHLSLPRGLVDYLNFP